MIYNNKIRVLIADDHTVYLDGLEVLLSNHDDIELVGAAVNGEQLIRLARQLSPDVILTDLKMPGIDGIQAIKEITALNLPCACIALSTFDTDYLIIEALEAGAMGYITKNVQRNEIIEAIKTVHDRQPYYCRTTSLRLARQIGKSSFNPYNKAGLHLFNELEKEMICLICREKTSEDIGKELFMAKRTVEGIRAKILEKAGVKTPIGLVVYAIKNAIYFIQP